jgi:hypothetical protein
MRRVQAYLAQLNGAGFRSEDPAEMQLLKTAVGSIMGFSKMLVKARMEIVGPDTEPNTKLLSDLQPDLPGDARVFQMLSVVEDWQHNHRIHVAISDSWDFAKSWGFYLAQIAEVVAREYPQLEGGLDAIRDGFIEHFAKEPQTLNPPDAVTPA